MQAIRFAGVLIFTVPALAGAADLVIGQRPGTAPIITAAVEAAPEEFDFRIALSPQAAARVQQRDNVNLYRRAAGGDSAAAKSWSSTSRKDQVAALSALAVTKEHTPARSSALRELAALSPSEDADGKGAQALARVAMADNDGKVREFARTGLAARQDERAIEPLVGGLRQDDPLIRDNAAAGLKAMGGPRVFELIVEHWREVWGPGPRAHCFFAQQRSYVADYDISGDSYDPIVRQFLVGVVLDVKSLLVECDHYYYTLREIAPADVRLPNNPAAWKHWIDEDRKALALDALKKRDAALAALERDVAAQRARTGDDFKRK